MYVVSCVLFVVVKRITSEFNLRLKGWFLGQVSLATGGITIGLIFSWVSDVSKCRGLNPDLDVTEGLHR
jgi:hypothetical protein